MTNSTTEVWVPVPGYESYQISDTGRIRNGNRVLKCAPGPNGYAKTRFGRTSPDLYVHHLVLLAFVGPRPEGRVIRHLDGGESNNAVANLAYGTPSENSLDTVRHGTNHYANKTHCPQGHTYSGGNLYTYPGGRRSCRTCARESLRRWRKRNPGK